MARARLSRARRDAARARARNRSLAEAEIRREKHAQLVAARAGDPRYPQQKIVDGNKVVTLNSEGTTTLRDSMERVHESFLEQFGRDMGPGDPLLWDPDAAEPTPLDEDSVAAMISELTEHVTNHPELGFDPAYLAAWNDVGYLVTDETLHLFSDEEVCAYESAVDYHQRVATR